MLELSEIKKERDVQLTQLTNDSLIFYAFSNEQFERNKTPLKEGDEYLRLGSGMFIPKSMFPQYKIKVKEILNHFKQIIDNNPILRYKNIAYELNNHECFYTGDIEDCMDALGEGYTQQEVKEVYIKELSTLV